MTLDETALQVMVEKLMNDIEEKLSVIPMQRLAERNSVIASKILDAFHTIREVQRELDANIVEGHFCIVPLGSTKACGQLDCRGCLCANAIRQPEGR